MAKLSKFYKVTRQIMIEYISDQYLQNEQVNTVSPTYMIYTGYDDNVYYTETPRKIDDMYNNAQYFIKFPDETDSNYTYLGLEKQLDGTYSNQSFIKNEIKNYTKNVSQEYTNAMHYDKIRIHFVYGFLLDRLSGFTLQVKTTASYLGPIQKHHDNSLTHLKFDDYGNPVFETDSVLYSDSGTHKREELERLVMSTKDFILLDYYFPKECLNFSGAIKYHKVPIYQNECFYDRYIEVEIPSAYFLSLDAQRQGVKLTVPNVYGYKQDTLKVFKTTDTNMYELVEGTPYNKKDILYYAEVPASPEEREISYNILPDPQLIISFATVSEQNTKDTNLELVVTGEGSTAKTYARTFYQDPLNDIAINYRSNSDFFNVRIFEDLDNNEIVYYPIFGDRELDWDVFNEIESGAIPLITEAFYDGLDNMDSFYEEYGENAYKWVIYNDITITYNYGSTINNLDAASAISSSTTQHFTNIIDYGQYNAEVDNTFWRNVFIPRVPMRNNSYAKSILISYTCRLANRLTGVEAIRNATLSVTDPEKYVAKRLTISNVTTYKVINQINRNVSSKQIVTKSSNDKFIRSYYDATNIVVKDMGTNSIYTQGQMTLYLKHTSSNYMLRLFTMNDDNVRIPFDLTGPYRYKLVFPTNKGEKISISPNVDSTDLNLGIGQLVFFISEEYVKQIMAVSDADRYFAIVTDVDKAEQMQSTLYEGKVSYFV